MDRELKVKLIEVAEDIFAAGQRSVVKTFADKMGLDDFVKRGRKRGRKRSGPTIKSKIVAALKKSGKPLTAPEIVSATKESKGSVNGALFQLKKTRVVKQPKRGVWTV